MAPERFTRSLRRRADAIWRRELEHPFVRAIADGTLALDKFRFYLRQDYVFLIDYCRVFALAASKAHDLGTIRLFAKLLSDTINTEMQLHRDYCAGFGISTAELETTRAAPATHAYTRHLLAVAHGGALADIVAAVLPCQLGYTEIGTALVGEDCAGLRSRYADWIRMYASEEFVAGAERVARVLDDLVAGYPDRELERLAELFLASSRYEYLFWEMAWTMSDWPV